MHKKKWKKGIILLLLVFVFNGSNFSKVSAEESTELDTSEIVNDESEKVEEATETTDGKIEEENEKEIIGNRLPEEFTVMDEEGNVTVVEAENGLMEAEETRNRSNNVQVVNFNTKGFSATTSYREVGTGISGYTCGAYGADAAYLGTYGNKVRFMLAGVIGEVNASEVQIVNFSSAKTISHYIVSGGRLYHNIATNMNSSYYGSTLDQGPSPWYLSNGGKYYSYDGHYFYSDGQYGVMLKDYANGTRKNAVNASEPYYNYFQYLPLRSKSNYSGSELNNIINNRVNGTSKMKDIGLEIVDKQNLYGVNALLVTGVAANESAWGSSNIAQSKNNLFGLNAVDSSPGQSANYYPYVGACIKDFTETYMSKQYLNPNDWKSFGGYLGNKASGINVKYASDPYWGEKAATVAWSLDKSNANRDAGTYTLGIKDVIGNEHTGLNIRKESNTSSTILYNTGSQSGQAFIILGEENGFYKIQSDPVLNSGRTSINNSSGNYDFSNMYAYASKNYIKRVNAGLNYWSAEGINTSLDSPQTMYEQIQLSADVSGTTSGLQYKFVWMKNNWDEWGVIQEFSNESTALWVPEESGDYKLYMDVRDNLDKMETVIVEYSIKNWGLQEIKTDLEAPQIKRTEIEIIPQIVGDSSGLQYKFVWMKNDWNEWGVIQEFSNNCTTLWKPKEAGEYTLYVDVLDQEGLKTTKTIKYSVLSKWWVFSGINVKQISPQELGNKLNISAEIENAGDDVKYKFVWMKNDWEEWGVIQPYSSQATAVWTPESIGKYKIYVDVKDGEGNEEHLNISYEIVQGAWDISNIETLPMYIQKIGNKVKISANIEGNKTGLEYKFVWMKDNWEKWGVVQGFSKKNTTSWMPNETGEYLLYIDVRDSSGAMKTQIVPYKISEKDWDYEGIKLNQNSPQEIGQNIDITPVIIGSTENLEYKYVWMKDNWNQWGVIKEFSNNTSVTWRPVEPGDYKIYVDVREKNEKDQETIWKEFKVVAGTWEIAGISFDMEPPQIANKEIEIAARIIGNKTGLEYKFVWMKDNWEKWGVIQQRSEKAKATWIPEETGEYKIYVDVFDSVGRSQTFIKEYQIEDWVITTNPLGDGSLGKEITVSVEGIQHNKNLEYKFVWMKNDWEKWGVIKGFTESQIAKWKPEEKGEYYLYVDVKDKRTNEIKSKRICYEIK